jgi:membrane-bound serine protease (ClpP class)
VTSLVIGLFALGILLLMIEVITPGGVLGAMGVLSMLGGCVLAFREYGPGGGAAAVGVALGILVLGLVIEFRVLPKTRLGK